MAKYSPAKSVQKSASVAILPVIIGEILPLVVPTIDRGNAYAIGTAVGAAISGFLNWKKNRRKAV